MRTVYPSPLTICSLQNDHVIRNHLQEMRAFENSALLLEKKGDFKDLLADAGQIVLSSGAVAATGGAGGDVVVDVIFAAKIAEEVLAEVTSIIASAGELGAIIIEAASLDFDGSKAFESQVQKLIERTVKNQLVGNKAKEMIEKASEKINEILQKIARAVGKWVGALIPDDLGLGGPTFEAMFEQALKAAGEDAYNVAILGMKALPFGAGKYLVDSDALEELLEAIATTMINTIDETIEWAESQREALEAESFSDVLARKGKAGIAALKGLAKTSTAAAKSVSALQMKVMSAPTRLGLKAIDYAFDGKVLAKGEQQQAALASALRNNGVSEKTVSAIIQFSGPFSASDALDQLQDEQKEAFKAGLGEYLDAAKEASKGEILYLSEKALPAVKEFLVKFRDDWIPQTVRVVRKLMSWLMAALILFQELINPEKYLEMETKMSPLEKGMEDTFKDIDLDLKESMDEDLIRGLVRELLVAEDVRKRDDEWCAYVDDKLTKAEKENNPKAHKGKKVGSIQRTKSGKPRMKARACYRSKKKANNAMAAAMMG
jgi:hypothetical protein